jgi:hypothetical protein
MTLGEGEREDEMGEEAAAAVPAPTRLALIWRLATAPDVIIRSLLAGLVVGTILNLINQGDVLWGNAESNLVKLGLTYMVPYFVTTYGSVFARLRDRKGRNER